MESFFRSDRPLVLAHRGASGQAPENTLASFRRAVELVADGVELDVQLSRDEQIVVFHDDLLSRTAGSTGRVSEKSWDELQQLDAGVWYNEAYRGEKIPALEQVLQLGSDDWRLNIELKQTKRPKELVRAVAARLGTLVNPLRCIFTSFDPELLHLMREMAPQASLGLIFAGAWPDESILRLWPVWSAEKSLLTRERIAQAHAGGFFVCAWTVNTIDEMQTQIELGVDAIITNYPERFHPVLSNFLASRQKSLDLNCE
jgi:glycerophosphoryl diester phosphodiesterase